MIGTRPLPGVRFTRARTVAEMRGKTNRKARCCFKDAEYEKPGAWTTHAVRVRVLVRVQILRAYARVRRTPPDETTRRETDERTANAKPIPRRVLYCIPIFPSAFRSLLSPPRIYVPLPVADSALPRCLFYLVRLTKRFYWIRRAAASRIPTPQEKVHPNNNNDITYAQHACVIYISLLS